MGCKPNKKSKIFGNSLATRQQEMKKLSKGRKDSYVMWSQTLNKKTACEKESVEKEAKKWLSPGEQSGNELERGIHLG